MSSRLKLVAKTELNGQFDIIINATSIGLSADTLPLSDTLNGDYAYDHDVADARCRFCSIFLRVAHRFLMVMACSSGKAALSFERWTGHTIDVAQATETLHNR